MASSMKKTLTDFDKFHTNQNNYQDINTLLEEETTLILINPNEEILSLGLILGGSVYNTVTVQTLEQAYALQNGRYKIIITNNEPFSETTLIKTIEALHEHDTGQVVSKNIIGVNNNKYKENEFVKINVEQYQNHDRPLYRSPYQFMCEELVSPWHGVLFPFNTELYKNPFQKINDTDFDYYNLVASGFFWCYILHCHKEKWIDQQITLFDISGANLMFQKNLIQHWSPWLKSYSDFCLENDFARTQLSKAGILLEDSKTKQINVEESKKILDKLWDQEIEKWDKFDGNGFKTFCDVWHIIKRKEANSTITYVNVNLISDHSLIKKWVSALKGKTFWFVSNIFTSHISRAWANGSRSEEFLQQQRILSFFNKEDVVFGTLLTDELKKAKKAKIV